MRSAFASQLIELATDDPRVILLTGDLGFAVLEPFARRFPDRFVNCGVAEQNMIGVASGLAEAGYTPYAYSIATFASMRGYEFLRNGAILHELPVRVVGVGGGMDYGHNGMTHYAVEDVGIMRVQPGITVVAPADPAQTRAALSQLQALPGPVYLRLGKESTAVDGLGGRFRLGRVEVVGDGGDVVIVALGGMAATAVAAAAELERDGIAACVAVVSSFNPSPEADLAELLAGATLAVTTEAHYVTGGLGSYVAELIAERGLSCRLERAGLRSMPVGVSGSRDYLYERHGISAVAIAAAVARSLDLAGQTRPN
jgi:transketolase